jgi:hypothetical protein
MLPIAPRRKPFARENGVLRLCRFPVPRSGCDHPTVTIWFYTGKLYEIVSTHSSPAWHYELFGLTGPPGTGPNLTVSIPDRTPDGPFTPMPAEHAVVQADGGTVPWLVLEKLIQTLEAGDDLVDEQRDPPTAFPLTLNSWSHGARKFEVNQFHYGDADAWSYELYEVNPATTENDYIEVRVPDAVPGSGPFTPMPSDAVTLIMHGRWSLPWPIFRRYLDAIKAAGDIVEPTGELPIAADRPTP